MTISRQPDELDRLIALLREQLPGLWNSAVETRVRREVGRFVRAPLTLEAQQIAQLLELSACTEGARRKARRELEHLRRATPGSAEVAGLRNWMEWMLELPWASPEAGPDAESPTLSEVSQQLERSHTRLGEVKNRVLEFLAVRQLDGEQRGTVLCFLGPPGTGKSSMARAVAEALGRKFIQVSVGGVSSEVELRGMHPTQPGAVPGRILQGVFRAGTTNPVILLDEIDKASFGESRSAAGVLLEILDPEQNREFLDHYLGVPYDLSRCVFVVTANDLEGMPEALVDRLEVIRFEGYTQGEKIDIARRHLIPRAQRDAGLSRSQLRLSPAALREIIQRYTEEAGVRQLQRVLHSLARKAAVRVVHGETPDLVRREDLLELLGPAQADDELHTRRARIGVAKGLAWTVSGGSPLPIEALAMPGSGRTILTGSIGEVMRESVQTAMSYVRTRLSDLQVDPESLDALDLHLHFPGGATPKDGPSAGIAIATSLISLLARVPVRHDVAMTGEMTLHGEVLPVGGLRDKILAAARAGMKVVVVPARNGEEVLRLAPEVRRGLKIHLVEHVNEVFEHALLWRRAGAKRPGRATPAEGLNPRTKRAAQAPKRNGSSRGRRAQ
jgi:ATP-dependent Lon protease